MPKQERNGTVHSIKQILDYLEKQLTEKIRFTNQDGLCTNLAHSLSF